MTGRTLTLGELPPPARAIAAAVADAVAAAGDGAAFERAAGRLKDADPEHVRTVLGGVVRILLEELHPDGIDADDLRDLVERSVRSAAPWFPGIQPDVLVVVLAGALGVHPDTPLDAQPGAAPDAPPDALPDDGAEERPAPPSPADVTRHAALLLADLLAARSRPLRPYLEATFTEMARAAASD